MSSGPGHHSLLCPIFWWCGTSRGYCTRLGTSLNLQPCKGVGPPLSRWEPPSCLGLHIPLQLEAGQHKVARLFAVMTSALVITATTISSASRVSTGTGGGSLHGSKIHRDGAWGSRVAGRFTVSPSHPFCHKCSPVKVDRVLNKHLCADRRC